MKFVPSNGMTTAGGFLVKIGAAKMKTKQYSITLGLVQSAYIPDACWSLKALSRHSSLKETLP